MNTVSKILVAASFLQIATGVATALDAMAPPAIQAEFDGFIAKFRSALKADDSAAVAGLTLLPFQNDASISNAAQFREKIYLSDFTPENRECIEREDAVYDRDGNDNNVYSIFCGELIFVFTKTASGFRLTDIGVND
jgi:hypothetical protein